MAAALDEARAATATGDVPVGAVVVGPDGAVVGRGRNRREATGDPTAHAEVLALREAAATLGRWRLDDCVLVVTLEPCLMCAGATVLARVSRLVLGAWDPKAGACGSQWDVVRDRRLNHRVEVVGGVREDECGAVLRDFFAEHR
ncbi:nucleoside deaminase [Cellulomonas sp. ATA003]|uniref:nucleoside deaminase n=1 Tax=Cellulomonas sp. ATA003 TaxID=3073064 RepID=UPI002873C207|nr:nucleoside deaminase [Cellulomonas sp. ATA003]WNB87636.1 nucleoside deaminase [Cellulomonas sp. ATA003]